MKGIVILALILVLIGAGLWWGVMRETMKDPGCWVLMAIGDPQEKTIDMVVSVEMGLTIRERPRLDDRLNPLWDEWIDQHYEVRDSAGNKAPFTRIAHSLLINEDKVKNVAEFYIKYVLRKGEAYTLDRIPSAAKQTRFRHEFTAPSAPENPRRVPLYAVKAP